MNWLIWGEAALSLAGARGHRLWSILKVQTRPPRRPLRRGTSAARIQTVLPLQPRAPILRLNPRPHGRGRGRHPLTAGLRPSKRRSYSVPSHHQPQRHARFRQKHRGHPRLQDRAVEIHPELHDALRTDEPRPSAPRHRAGTPSRRRWDEPTAPIVEVDLHLLRRRKTCPPPARPAPPARENARRPCR